FHRGNRSRQPRISCRSRTSSSNNRTNKQLHGRNRPRRRTTSRISRKTKHPNKPIQTLGTWGQGTWGQVPRPIYSQARKDQITSDLVFFGARHRDYSELN